MTGLAVEKSFHVADDPKAVYYYQQISACKDSQIFHITWGGCIIKNCMDSGELLEFEKISDYEEFLKQEKKQLWLCMSLKVFRYDEAELYGVYCCPECESMAGIPGLAIDQEPDAIRDRLCIHSRVASSTLGNWRNLWNVSLSVSQDQVFNV